MNGLLIGIIVIAVIVFGLWLRRRLLPSSRHGSRSVLANRAMRRLSPLQRKWYAIWIFFVVNLRRVFRDRTAMFFTFLFPLIFLFIFGGIFGHNSNLSFKVALINQSSSPIAQQFVSQAEAKNQKLLDVNTAVTNLAQANDKMSRSELDATIVLPSTFGAVANGHTLPSGQAIIYYTQNNQQAAQTLSSVIQTEFQSLNARFVSTQVPFTVTTTQSNAHSLSQFDYTFTGLLGFAILGTGIFGPMNVFPELKKMGILRRLHTTPLRVWQYFMSTMVGYATVGLLSLALMFVVAMVVFHLKVVGNYIELAIFLTFGITMILGIGLALGGWAKNERQVAPLGNILVFPMMFLTGVFFPRFLMPEWLQGITNYIPLTPVIDGARLIATEGKSIIDLGPQLAVMAVWTAVIYVIAFRVFRWE